MNAFARTFLKFSIKTKSLVKLVLDKGLEYLLSLGRVIPLHSSTLPNSLDSLLVVKQPAVAIIRTTGQT